MNNELRTVLSRLLEELRKDFWFFGLCGVAVALFMIWQYRLKELGIAGGESWPKELFSDFVSFNAFGLVFLGLIFVGSLATTAAAIGHPLRALERAVAHLESRLAQLASSIISFTVGLSALALLHSLLTVTAGGLALALLIVLFCLLIVSGFVTAALVTRRTEPFDKWWVSALTLAFSIGIVATLLLKGAK